MTKAEKALAALMRSTAHSEAIKSGIQQSMRAGKVKLNYSQFLGYTKDASGQLIIESPTKRWTKSIKNAIIDTWKTN